MACLLLLLISVLGLISHSEGKTEEINNVYFVKATELPAKIMLTCDTSKEQRASVYWLKNTTLEGNGRSLEKTIRGNPDAGQYVCRSNITDAILSYSTVYIDKTNDKGEVTELILCPFKEESNRVYVKCTANNYSGNFKCFWKPLEQNSNLKFTIKVTSGNAVCDEPIESETGMYTASCRRGILCPLTEEYQETGIALEVFHGFDYEEHRHNFFTKDILKPDAVECQMENTTLLTWTPPKTWSSPVSYYGLTYQIKIVQHRLRNWICEVDNDMVLRSGNSLSCHNRLFHRGPVYIRSRDLYKKSAWSDWSEPCRKQNGRQDVHKNEDGIKIRQCDCKKN